MSSSSAPRINYPESWEQSSRDALDEMFGQATKAGLWFFHGGLSGPLWFSPVELDAQQKKGQFVWGAVNWTLRDPREFLEEARTKVQAALAECQRARDRLVKAGVI